MIVIAIITTTISIHEQVLFFIDMLGVTSRIAWRKIDSEFYYVF